MTVTRRRQYGFNTIAYLAFTGLLAIGAVNSQNNLLFLAFGFALGAVLLSGVIGGTMLLNVRLERDAPKTGQVGEPLPVGYAVTNAGRRLPAFAITIREEPAPGSGHSTRAERMAAPVAFAPHVGARRTIHVTGWTTPTRRGVASYGAMSASCAFPFGLFRKVALWAPEPHEPRPTTLIRPRPIAVAASAVRAAFAELADGAATASTVGRTDEFFGLREYAPGDTMRQIAWKASARTGTLVVRENVAPSPARAWVILCLEPASPRPAGRRRRGARPDATGSEANEAAIALAAGVILEAHRQGIDVGLLTVGATEPTAIAPRAGPGQVARLLDALALVEPAPAGRAPPPAPAPEEDRISARGGARLVVRASARAPSPGLPGGSVIDASAHAPLPSAEGAPA